MTELEKNTITDILTEKLAQLSEETSNCLKVLSTFKYKNNQYLFDSWIKQLECCRSQIIVHKDLCRTDLIEVDFSKEIYSYFIDKKYRKKAVFYLCNENSGEKTQIEDQETLSRLFTLKYCMPVMQLVPMQLALNARKYMPIETNFDIRLSITEKRKYITFSNIGPQCDDEEINDITKEGTRGQNTKDYFGMGIGLSEVQTILDLHKEWLQTTFDINSDSEFTILNGNRHSVFSVCISFLRQPSNSDIQPLVNDLRNKIPTFLIHNAMDISNSLLDTCDNLIRILKTNENQNKDRLKHVYGLRLSANILLKTVYECVYISNGNSITDIIGKECSLNLKSVFVAITKELRKKYFAEMELDYMGILKAKYTNFQTFEGMRSFILSICELTMKSLRKDAKLEINFDDNQIMMKCDDAGSFTKFKVLINNNEYLKKSYMMCMDFIDFFQGRILINNNNITILLP